MRVTATATPDASNTGAGFAQATFQFQFITPCGTAADTIQQVALSPPLVASIEYSINADSVQNPDPKEPIDILKYDHAIPACPVTCSVTKPVGTPTWLDSSTVATDTGGTDGLATKQIAIETTDV